MRIILSEKYIKFIMASRPYGWWLGPEGEKIEVSDNPKNGHFEVAQRMWEKKYGRRSSDIYTDMMEEGWIRISSNIYDDTNSSLSISLRSTANKQQVDMIWGIINTYSIAHVEIHNGIYYDLDSIKKIRMYLEKILNRQSVIIPKNIQTTMNSNPQFFEPKE